MSELPATASGRLVWDRLWSEAPSADRDDALLARERRSPRWTLIVQHLQAAFGSLRGLRTIELGSGRGDLSALLAECGARVTLLDSSAPALDQARRRFERIGLNAEFVSGDLLDVPNALRAGFDAALSSGVIEHFEGNARTAAARAHHDCVRPGGMAIISVPHAWCVPYRVWKFYLELRGWWPYGLERPYTWQELVRRAGEAGFVGVDARAVGFWQSVGDHWGRSLLGRGPDWVERRSFLDRAMGLSLLLFGRRDT